MTTKTSSKRRPVARLSLPGGLLPVPPLSIGSAAGGAPVVEDTLRAAQVIWFAAALEHARLFDAVDRLVDRFRAGQLPVRKGSASALLYEYWQERDERLSPAERRRLYARAFGIGGARADGVVPNRMFPELWLAFLDRVQGVGPASKQVALIERAEVRGAARALAVNLSRFAAGMARPAAALHEHIQQALALLADPDVRGAYDARDVWQLVDKVTALYLGAASSTARYRTLANAGSTVIGWLARNAGALNGGWSAASGGRPFPTDAELLDAIVAWLATTDEDQEDEDDA